MAKDYYFWLDQTSKGGSKRIKKGSFESDEDFSKYMADRPEGYSEMTAKELNTAQDSYDKQTVGDYNKRLDSVSSGETSWYWGFNPTVDSIKSGTPMNQWDYQAYATSMSDSKVAEWNTTQAKFNPYQPAIQKMSGEEAQLQTDILTQKRDTIQTNINTRQQEFSNRQTQANISQTPTSAARGSSTRRKEKRGGRASTLLAGSLGGSRASTASRALLGG